MMQRPYGEQTIHLIQNSSYANPKNDERRYNAGQNVQFPLGVGVGDEADSNEEGTVR